MPLRVLQKMYFVQNQFMRKIITFFLSLLFFKSNAQLTLSQTADESILMSVIPNYSSNPLVSTAIVSTSPSTTIQVVAVNIGSLSGSGNVLSWDDNGSKGDIAYQDYFIPEDVSLMNFQGANRDIYCLTVGKLKLNPSSNIGYSIVLDVLKWDGSSFIRLTPNLIIIDSWTTGIYDKNSDDIVRIDDNFHSVFGIVYQKMGIVELIPGIIDLSQASEVSLSNSIQVFPNSQVTNGIFTQPDIGIANHSYLFLIWIILIFPYHVYKELVVIRGMF